MYSSARLAWKYLHYYFTAANGKGHGIHSPFVYDFVRNVLNDRGSYPDWGRIEELRGRLLRDERRLRIEDMGAGSVYAGGAAGADVGAAAVADMGVGMGAGTNVRPGSERTISDIARRAAKPRRLGQLLFRIAHHYQPVTVLELGTSLGLSTAYLATGAPSARVISIEGSGEIIETAAENLRSLGLTPELIQGNFDVLLDPLLGRMGRGGRQTADDAGSPEFSVLAFVDGNHRCEAPTLRYFHSLMAHVSAPAVLIFDDIHWSADMEKAWAAIRADARVYMTIDLFFIGLVFLRDEFKIKQDFMIRF